MNRHAHPPEATGKASEKVKAALAVVSVSEPFGCGTGIPVVERAFCPSGEVELAFSPASHIR